MILTTKCGIHLNSIQFSDCAASYLLLFLCCTIFVNIVAWRFCESVNLNACRNVIIINSTPVCDSCRYFWYVQKLQFKWRVKTLALIIRKCCCSVSFFIWDSVFSPVILCTCVLESRGLNFPLRIVHINLFFFLLLG